MEKKPMCIVVSELSALAGRHRYKTATEAIINHLITREPTFCFEAKQKVLEEDLLEKPRLEKIIKSLAEAKIDFAPEGTPAEQIKECQVRFPEITEKVPEVRIEIRPEKVQGLQEVVRTQVDILAKNKERVFDPRSLSSLISAELPPEATPEVMKMLPAVRGRILEESIYSRLRDLGLETGEKQKAFSKPFTLHGIPLVIYGKVDGLNLAGSQIIEIKNRQNRIFKPNPSYDIDQLAAYVFLAPEEVKGGILVQALNPETPLQLDEFSRESLEERWLAILNSPVLEASLRTLNEFRESPTSRTSLRFAREHLLGYEKA